MDDDEIRALVVAIRAELSELRAERERVRLTLRAFYFAEVSLSAVQPLIDLAEELNPGIRLELDALRAGWTKAPEGGVH